MNVETNASLRALNSFGFECIADELVVVTRSEDLALALDTDQQLTILGEGTNVVLKPRLAGRVLRPLMQSIDVERRSDGLACVRALAGVNWHELVRYTLGQGIGGLENLALIPGSVGAAPFQNIGAYGVELHRLCESVQVFDRETRELRDLLSVDCGFAYRDSVFKSISREKYVICGVTLLLGRDSVNVSYRDVAEVFRDAPRNALTPTRIADVVTRIRRRKLPAPRQFGNVGSFFKNPILADGAFDALRSKLVIDGHREAAGVKVAAARLIDSAGWKGKTVGDAQVWPRQPLVLVNRGRATAGDVLELAKRIADDVRRRFDVTLELEPQVLGAD